MDKGSYSLMLEADTTVEVGALGEKQFKGIYVYNGSAFGPGGLKRVRRHFRTAKGEGSTHWHIDYLLRNAEVKKAFIFPGRDLECELSMVMDNPVEGFGSSDCDCSSHLYSFDSMSQVESVMEGFGDFRVLRPQD